ncbi:unnamed protein product, partial [Meganyctiphanes norvegica]
EEKCKLSKKEAMHLAEQAKLEKLKQQEAMHVETQAKIQGLEKQKEVTERFKKTDVDKGQSDVGRKCIPRITNLQHYMASWKGVQQRKLSSSLDSEIKRKDTPRPQSRFSTGMLVSSLKIPDFRIFKKSSEVTNEEDSPKLQSKGADEVKTHLMFNSSAAENSGSPILGSKRKQSIPGNNNVSTNPSEAKSSPSTLSKPNNLLPLKPFTFNVSSFQFKSEKNINMEKLPSTQLKSIAISNIEYSPSTQIDEDNNNSRLSQKFCRVPCNSAVSPNFQTSNPPEHQLEAIPKLMFNLGQQKELDNKNNEDNSSLSSDSEPYVTPESSLEEKTNYFTADSSPDFQHSSLETDIEKKVRENIVNEVNHFDDSHPDDQLLFS